MVPLRDRDGRPQTLPVLASVYLQYPLGVAGIGDDAAVSIQVGDNADLGCRRSRLSCGA